MFDGLLKGKFHSKCKLAARMTKARLDTIMKKRTAMKKFLKNDMGDLLKNGLDKNAYTRAEGYLVEENMTLCYGFVEKFNLQILNNVIIMSKQSDCPEDCNEAVSSLIYAAARFADLPDLRELRKLFTERYGTSLDSYVNKEFINKLKLVPPTQEMKLQLMQDIADQLGLHWDCYAAKENLIKQLPKDFEQVNNSATNNELQAHKIPEERTPFRNFPREGKKEVAKENVEDNGILKKPLPSPPYRRSNVDQTGNNDEGHGVAVRKSRAKPQSIRRLRSKNEYDVDDVGASSGRKADQDSNHNKPDAEEQMLDKMLIRHSLKKSTLCEMESDQKSGMIRHGSSGVGKSKQETKNSTDYDNLVARLTAFKEDI